MNGHAFLRIAAGLFILLHAASLWPFSLGIENCSDSFLKSLQTTSDISPRVGIITNQTGVDQKGNRTVDILQNRGVRVVYILAPEHGFDGKTPAGRPVYNMVDRKTGIPVVSVYGRGGDQTITGKQLDPAILKQLDILMYDMQDVGMRHYTYISTLLCALNAASEYSKPIIVLDRPNLLGPNMEGPLVQEGLSSFISIAPIPVRHGMTVGEIARYFNMYIVKKPASLYVIKMGDYNRSQSYSFCASLSPNLQTHAACKGYSFLGLLGEVEPFDVGVGTPYAFQVIALPDAKLFSHYEWSRLKVLLQRYGIHAMHHTAIKRRQGYTGLRLSIADISRVQSFQLLLELLYFFKKAGLSYTFSKTFDKAVGSRQIQAWCTGACSRKSLFESINGELQHFFAKAQKSFLYDPPPKVTLLQ